VPYVQFNNFFLDQFGGFTFKNIHTALLEHVFQIHQPEQQPTIYSCISDNHFEIIVLQENKLLFFNSFEYQTPQDFIYYVLFVYEQLKLDTNNDTLHVFGMIDNQSDLYALAYTYIKNITFVKPTINSSVFNISDEIAQKHFILLNA